MDCRVECLARGHPRRVFGDIADSASGGMDSALREAIHARGARCRLWTNGASLFGWQCRKERTGASCADGSGFILTQPRRRSSGGVAGRSFPNHSRRPHFEPDANRGGGGDAHSRVPDDPAWALARFPVSQARGDACPAHSTVQGMTPPAPADLVRRLVALRRSIASRSPRPICFGKWTCRRVTCRWRTVVDATR